MADPEIKVDADLRRRLVALTRCASKDTSRPVLCAVQFSKNRVAATDSYVLGVVDLPDELPGEWALPAKPLAMALSGKGETWRIAFGAESARITVETPSLWDTPVTSTHDVAYVKGAYPNWRDLLPKGEPQGGVPTFDPARLAQVTALADSHVRLVANGEVRAMQVWQGNTLLGLVMPVRSA